MGTNDLSEQVKVFYSDGYKVGMEVVENGLSLNTIKSGTSKLYENIDALNEMVFSLAEKQGTRIFCKKGCEWCCHQPVYALKHEIIYLKEFIKSEFSNSQKEEILQKAIEKNQKIGNLDESNLLNSKHPCPLLINGACIAYRARPMACRIYLSLSLSSCESFYQKPDSKDNFPKVMHFPLQAGRMLNEGFKAALKQAGWNSAEYRIEEGLLTEINIF